MMLGAVGYARLEEPVEILATVICNRSQGNVIVRSL
jgi:hypothetical protein